MDHDQQKKTEVKAESDCNTSESQPVSKRQAKKKERYLQKLKDKPLKRKLEKERKKAGRVRKRAEGVPPPVSRRQLKKHKPGSGGFAVCIDMSFDDLMHDRDVKGVSSVLVFNVRLLCSDCILRHTYVVHLHSVGPAPKNLGNCCSPPQDRL